MPGLKVLQPSTPQDAKGLLLAAKLSDRGMKGFVAWAYEGELAIVIIKTDVLPVRSNDDVAARSDMMMAATFAGMGFGNAGVHIPHANAYPIAHELCTMEIALARSSVGQVSATSVAPVFHSPPMPSPRMKRPPRAVT